MDSSNPVDEISMHKKMMELILGKKLKWAGLPYVWLRAGSYNPKSLSVSISTMDATSKVTNRGCFPVVFGINEMSLRITGVPQVSNLNFVAKKDNKGEYVIYSKSGVSKRLVGFYL